MLPDLSDIFYAVAYLAAQCAGLVVALILAWCGFSWQSQLGAVVCGGLVGIWLCNWLKNH